jgi:multiple sugar transport system ATP-binding protein
MYVADFIGSPPMNFLKFHAGLAQGDASVTIRDAQIVLPTIRENRAPAELALGVRPEHIRLDDSSKLRGQILGAEYLGTTQIVVVETPAGIVKARIPAAASVHAGEQVGLALNGPYLSLFETATGRAIATDLSKGAAHG